MSGPATVRAVAASGESDHAVAQSEALLPMLETPPDLEAETLAQQRLAPDCGLGFRRARLDSELHEQLIESLRANAGHFRAEDRIEYLGNDDPGTIPALVYIDTALNDAVSAALKPRHEAWSGMRLVESACYGIRVYQRGTYLYNHVDRTRTHIVSATICVDRRLRSRWPLYIEDGRGRGHQIDMEPGDLVLYEGARLRHGRAYPLDGDYYAGLFVHYRPADPVGLATPAA